MIRPVKHSDAEAIRDIYNYYIRETSITFEETELSENDINDRIEKVTQKFPWIIYEEGGKVIGYAYANTWRERVAYRFSCESSVYLDPELKGKGVGSQLYKHLIAQLKKQGVKQVIGGITLPNPNSENFHEKLGFNKVGHFKSVGYKFNEWHDVGFYQLEL